MDVTASALSLNVVDPQASAAFAERHLHFKPEMAAEGFISLGHAEAGFNLIFLRLGLETFKPASMQGHRADGLLVVFVVEDIGAEYERLLREGVDMTSPLETEPWGERSASSPIQAVSSINSFSGWRHLRSRYLAIGCQLLGRAVTSSGRTRPCFR